MTLKAMIAFPRVCVFMRRLLKTPMMMNGSAIRRMQVLCKLHGAGWLHGDVRPSNVMLVDGSNEVGCAVLSALPCGTIQAFMIHTIPHCL